MIRKRRRSTRTTLLAAVLAVPAVLTVGATGTAAPKPAAVPSPAVTGTVTLLTGDRVTLGGPGGVTIRPAPGREKMGFVQSSDGDGGVSVVPTDMRTAVASGRVDRRLFSVTKLIKHGYDDRSRDDIPVIVSGGQRSGRYLDSVGATAIRVAKADRAKAFLSSVADAERIWLDGPVHAELDQSVPQIGAPDAWRAGHTGKGATVAVLDTGIDASHPDLAGAVTAERNFSTSPDASDQSGHGTHVASIITGQHAKYQGVAPDTKLLNGKVLDDSGMATESQIIAGMEWAAASGADVVNMSLGSSLPSDGTDLMSQAVNRLSARTGSLFVVAAGNGGEWPDRRPGGPAAADAALTVGAVDKQDALAPFSTRGPRDVDNAIKPDITAPGVGIAAARAKDARIGTPVDDQHIRLSGTSMSTPHVAGAAAVLAAQHPDWTGEQLKAALMASARPNPALTVFQQGAGRVDLGRAVTQPVYATPPSISNGVVPAPHDQAKPIVKTLTYHNTGTSPITLDLTVDARDPAGNTAPAGLFTVAPAKLTVPAGGQAQTTVTTNTAVDGPLGVYSGSVVASGGTELRTPVTVTRDPETYEVKLTVIDHDGKPASIYSVLLANVTEFGIYQPYNTSGTVTVRVPKGRYALFGNTTTSYGLDSEKLTIWVEPELVVNGPTALTLDARDGERAEFHIAQPGAVRETEAIFADRPTAWGLVYQRYVQFNGGIGPVYARPSRTAAAPGEFQFRAFAILAEPDGQGGHSASPYLYSLQFSEDRRIPGNLSRDFPDHRLGQVRSKKAGIAPGSYGNINGSIKRRPLPSELTEFYSPGVPWYRYLDQSTDPDPLVPDTGQFTAGPTVFEPGQVLTDRFDFGVRGPAFPPGKEDPWSYAARQGDELRFDLSMISDDSGVHAGWTAGGGSAVLSRDNKPIEPAPPLPGDTRIPMPHFGRYILPHDTGTYRFHVDVATPVAVTSTKVSADWTFTSAPVSTPDPQRLPLLAVRYSPKLDDTNHTSARVPTVVPLAVTGNNAVGKVRSLQVSHDDGVTWRHVPLIVAKDRAFAVLTHPKGAQSVSLKATAADDKGNSVDQTIIRAFLLK